MTTSEIGIRYFDRWYSFASEKDLADARQQIANAAHRHADGPHGVLISALNNGQDVQLLVSPGADVVIVGEWK